MKKYLILTLLLSACCTSRPVLVPVPIEKELVLPKQIECLDTLAGAQYGNQLKQIPKQYGIRGFAKKEFGDFFPMAKAALEQGRPWVGVNLLWSDTHQFGPSDLPFVTKEAARYEPLCQKYPGKVELAPFTEHNLKDPDKLLDQVQKAAPSCTLVNSVYQGAFSKKYKNEVHGNHKKPQVGPYNYSFDGTNSVDSNVVKFLADYSDAEVFCMWHPRFNLRYRMKDTANRAQRVKEAKQRSPNRDLLLSVAYLFGPPGPIKIPKNWLVKSHAEKHDAQDQKGDKLLIISPVKANYIDLWREGVRVATLAYYGIFDGGGYRYYWNRFGYTAGANLSVLIGKKNYGTINGGFRAGNFR